MLGPLGEAFSKAGKLNDRADVWRFPVRLSTDDVDADVKEEDEHTSTAASKDAYVMDEIGSEEVPADEQGNVSPGPAAEEEDARIPTMRSAPRELTRQEIDEHNITRLLFRSWCPSSIAAKAKHWPQRLARDVEGAEEGVPSIHMDCFFMRDDEVDENVTVINYKEKHTKAFGAHVVKKKGLDAGVAERIIKHIERWCCKDTIIVKTDQEPSIQAVTDDMRRPRSGETIIDASKKYDSQSHSITERVVQTKEGQVRAMLLAFESRLDAKIPVTRIVITWLVEHVADILNKFAVGIDGGTAYDRIKGKEYHGEMVEFGRRVMCKIPCKPKGD